MTVSDSTPYLVYPVFTPTLPLVSCFFILGCLILLFMRYPFTGSYKITQKFGQANAALTGGIHKGVDYSMPSGTPVLAITSGHVVSAGYSRSAGNFVTVRSQDIVAKYFHLTKVFPSVGVFVKEGQKVGSSGNTGLSTGPHMHLQVEIKGVPVDPLKVINNGDMIPAQQKPDTPALVYHTIIKGDTFYAIENSIGLKHGTIQELNPEINPRKLRIGGVLRVQAAPITAQPILHRLYTIRRGDTFWSLENAWQLPHGRLQELNPRVNPRLLQIGQSIFIG